MAEQPYPHSRNDCDSCREFDADMAAHHDGRTGRDLRWCQRCAGQLIGQLVLAGLTVTVCPLDDPTSDGSGVDQEPDKRTGDGPEWTVDLAEQILRLALPSGSVFLRALINEGGTATVQRLKELTASNSLHHMTLTVNSAMRKLAGGRTGSRPRHLAEPRRDPHDPRKHAVHDYALPANLVPIFDEALRRLGR